MILWAILVVYLTCGVLAAAQCLADLEREFPYFAWRNRTRNLLTAAMGIIGGPVSLVAAIFFMAERRNRFRFHFWPMSRADSWAAFQEQFPRSDEETFEHGPK